MRYGYLFTIVVLLAILPLTAAEKAQWVGKLEQISKQWIARFENKGMAYGKLYTAYTGKNA